MARSRDAFSWEGGKTPECRIHSRIKLHILRSYLAAYFDTVTQNPAIDAVNIHLVDAFCGGGIFRDSVSGLPVHGSPIVMLQTVKQSEERIAGPKTKPFRINATCHFADRNAAAVSRLRETINEAGFGEDLSTGRVIVDVSSFEQFLPVLLQRIPSNQKTKSIVFLDQSGWRDATLKQCNAILRHLPKAEIIWNINIESLAAFATDSPEFRKAVSRFGVTLDDAFTSQPSYAHFSDWRKALVAVFLQRIRETCIAEYVSPFMFQHDGWGYWLLHLSNHPQANNVMKLTHWSHQNSSLHEGFPGLRMLQFDRDNWQQARTWRFDDDAANATHEALISELGQQIRTLGESPTVASLIASVANETPADRERLYRALSTLRADGELSIRGPNNERRKEKPQSLEDRLIIPRHRPILLPGVFDPDD